MLIVYFLAKDPVPKSTVPALCVQRVAIRGSTRRISTGNCIKLTPSPDIAERMLAVVKPKKYSKMSYNFNSKDRHDI